MSQNWLAWEKKFHNSSQKWHEENKQHNHKNPKLNVFQPEVTIPLNPKFALLVFLKTMKQCNANSLTWCKSKVTTYFGLPWMVLLPQDNYLRPPFHSKGTPAGARWLCITWFPLTSAGPSLPCDHFCPLSPAPTHSQIFLVFQIGHMPGFSLCSPE